MSALQPQSDPARAAEAAMLTRAFAARTGVMGDVAPRRYLWTDAFAVCNCIALAAHDPASPFAALAARLVDQVHAVLGHHRPDGARRGWISGLDEAQGARHPTAGGLRIGKPHPERDPGARFDADLEWERDGQYFHYLTRWMHALDQFAHAFDHRDATLWAGELAQAAHHGFVQHADDGTPVRMAWKMSIDLKRVLVPSMGQHDPLDGLVTALQLRARAAGEATPADFAVQIRDYAVLADLYDWRTDDPLGLGGLLCDACRLAQLRGDHVLPGDHARGALLTRMLDAAAAGLVSYARRRPLQQPPAARLAFRELGLAIGLQALPRIRRSLQSPAPALLARLSTLAAAAPLAESILQTWRDPAHQRSDGWRAHEDINAVMLATCLLPSGYLDLQ